MQRVIAALAVVFLVVLGLAACGGSGERGEAGKGENITIGMFANFGEGAGGPIDTAGCVTAQHAIDAAGGVLGHEISCQRYDSGADPADAVPAAAKMLSSASNLALTVGPNEVAPATAPIISAEKIVMMSASGDSHFNENTDPYFYRIVPSDSVIGEAQAYRAFKSGFKNVALLFENGAGALTVVKPVKETLEKLNVNITTNLTVAPDQSSYRTEVQSLLASKPEVILSETDSQTASTFFSELLELNNGQMIPLQGTPATAISEYQQSLVGAIGAENVEKDVSGTTVAAAEPGPALSAYQHALTEAASEVPEAGQLKTEPYATAWYDCNTAAALAMVAAKSTSPEKYQPFIAKVTGAPGGGRVEVNTFAEGVKELEAGKEIVYMGTSGPILWDKFHNREGTFQAVKFDPTTEENEVVESITSEEMKKALGE